MVYILMSSVIRFKAESLVERIVSRFITRSHVSHTRVTTTMFITTMLASTSF